MHSSLMECIADSINGTLSGKETVNSEKPKMIEYGILDPRLVLNKISEIEQKQMDYHIIIARTRTTEMGDIINLKKCWKNKV